MAQTIEAIRYELRELDKYETVFDTHDTFDQIRFECRRIRREELRVKLESLVANN